LKPTSPRADFTRFCLVAIGVAGGVASGAWGGELCAQTSETPRAIRLSLPGMERVGVRKDLVYKPSPNAATALHFDLYYPPDFARAAALPVVVFVNGVGFRELKDWPVYESWARATAVSGLAAVTFETDKPSVEGDIDALMEHLRTHASELSIDANNMCWWACSANVNRALPLALQEDRKYLRCAVLYYGMPEYWPRIRPDLPLFVVKAGLDNPDLNQLIDKFTTQAAAQNQDLTYLVYGGGRHAFDVFDDTLRSKAIIEDTLRFMQMNLSPAVQKENEDLALLRSASAAFLAHDWTATVKAYEQVVLRQPQNGDAHYRLGLAQHYLANFDAAIAAFRRDIDLGYMVPAATYNVACAQARQGQIDNALASLRLALERGFEDRALMDGDADLANLRGDPRFAALVKEWFAKKRAKDDKQERKQ
jgi:tetratricopeptide (TPR) repeat protein